MRLAAGLVIAILVVGASRGSEAQIVPTGQDRSVSANSTSYGDLWQQNTSPFAPFFDPPAESLSDSDSQLVEAPDLSPFDATAASTDPLLIIVAPQGSASASQTSSLSAAEVVASGSFAATGHARTLTGGELDLANTFFSPPVPFSLGILSDSDDADSSFSATFDVSAETPFSLTGSLALSPQQGPSGFTNGSANIMLVGPIGIVAFVGIDQSGLCGFTLPCDAESDSIDLQGALVPGSYTLTASAAGGAMGMCADAGGVTCQSPSLNGSFDLSLSLGPVALPALSPLGLVLASSALATLGVFAVRPPRLRRRHPRGRSPA